jgi:SAM-dependent methyltransferase
MRVANRDTGGTSFADLVWKPVVLVEMKKRGENLQKHYRQAFNYWTRLVPDRPRYVVLCNFDEFWVYDFETDIDAPKDVVSTEQLRERWGALAFLAGETPQFGLDREAVTRNAADKLAVLFNRLTTRGVAWDLAQRFVLQMLVALFSEDIGLLEKYLVSRLLDDCVTPADSYDLIGGLFEAMNAERPTSGGRFKDVQYFDGGLFAHPAKVELSLGEMVLLRGAAQEDWSKVQPEIFGTLFQHSLGAEARHAFGAHFTHPPDIMRIVRPTITDPWREQIERATTLRRLLELRDRLNRFRVLDPACGSGNFLYMAYRELKRVEASLYERIAEFRSRPEAAQIRLSFLSAANFCGIDILPFAVEIAKVTMVIARKMAIDELHIAERALPLDNLDANFLAGDALIAENGGRREWPKVDGIIGNPPFLGTKRLKPERGSAYVRTLRGLYPSIPGMADYCVYWFRRAHDHLPACTPEDPVAGRAGLVGTQNVRNNQSRVGGLDYIVKTGTIVEAVDNQPWPGEANVHVSIVNWVKSHDPKVLPAARVLWFKAKRATRVTGENGPGAAAYELRYGECAVINSALSDNPDVSGAKILSINAAPQRTFQGVTPGHAGFVLSAQAHKALVGADRVCEEVIRPYLIGREVVSGSGSPRRYVIDFDGRSILQAKRFASAFNRIELRVLPDAEKKAKAEDDSESARKQHLEHWWHHWRDRSDMKLAIRALRGRYITGSRTQRWPFVFCFMSRDVLPGDKMQVFAFDDDYSFGILQGAPHLEWYKAKAARLKNEEDYNYSSEWIFNTFPWPQKVTEQRVLAVAEAARAVRRVRDEHLATLKCGLRKLYRTLELPGRNPLKDAHATLDAAVVAAYGFSTRADLLTQLLELNFAVASAVSDGRPASGPGIPENFDDPSILVSGDCIPPSVEGSHGKATRRR